MSRFTVEETNLMCIYNVGSRTDLLSELSAMQKHLQTDETELLDLTKSVIDKLTAMDDADFENISDELIGDFELIEWQTNKNISNKCILVLDEQKHTCYTKAINQKEELVWHIIMMLNWKLLMTR